MDDFQKLVVTKITEISERCARIETTLDHVKEDVDYIKLEDAEQNRLLDEHIAGVNTQKQRLEVEIKNRLDLEKSLTKVDTRVKKLEFLPTVIRGLGKLVIALSAVLGLTISILKLVDFFKI